jgi:ParB family transcriptional regulator, chromosome partitioning protein
MEIEKIKTSNLIPYARNSRTHSDSQVSQIAGSIREFGFTNPVLIDSENGIIAGHGRVMAAQKLELAEVPCIRLDHLTDTQRRAYIIADNKLALNSGWDEEMLGLELADLRELDFDLGLLGFTEDEVGAFDVEEAGMPELSSDDKQPFQQMTFTIHDEQAEDVQAAIAKAKSMGHGDSAVNENSNGNALAFICQSFNR